MVTKQDPTIEHPRDAIVRVTRAAICGSDLHLYHGLVPDTRIGSTFGHEFTGVVEEVGAAVTNLVRGDRVVVPFNIACGECFQCRRGFTACCESSNPSSDITSGVYGYSHESGGYEGAQSQFVRVPFADFGPMKIPADLEEEQVLLLGDNLPTGWQAAEMAEIEPGDTVAVFGCGPVGLFAQKAAWLQGAGRVIAIDQVDYRLDMARRFAGAEVLNFREVGDVVLALRDMCNGRGPDAAIDAVGLEASGSRMHDMLRVLKAEAGAATALEWAIHAVRKSGRVSVVGVYGPPWNLVPLGVAMNKNLTLRMGQCNVKKYMPKLVELIRSGAIDPRQIITHRLPLTDGPAGYRLLERKLNGAVKCVLIPS